MGKKAAASSAKSVSAPDLVQRQKSLTEAIKGAEDFWTRPQKIWRGRGYGKNAGKIRKAVREYYFGKA
jgi:hypothetical protein